MSFPPNSNLSDLFKPASAADADQGTKHHANLVGEFADDRYQPGWLSPFNYQPNYDEMIKKQIADSCGPNTFDDLHFKYLFDGKYFKPTAPDIGTGTAQELASREMAARQHYVGGDYDERLQQAHADFDYSFNQYYGLKVSAPKIRTFDDLATGFLATQGKHPGDATFGADLARIRKLAHTKPDTTNNTIYSPYLAALRRIQNGNPPDANTLCDLLDRKKLKLPFSRKRKADDEHYYCIKCNWECSPDATDCASNMNCPKCGEVFA